MALEDVIGGAAGLGDRHLRAGASRSRTLRNLSRRGGFRRFRFETSIARPPNVSPPRLAGRVRACGLGSAVPHCVQEPPGQALAVAIAERLRSGAPGGRACIAASTSAGCSRCGAAGSRRGGFSCARRGRASAVADGDRQSLSLAREGSVRARLAMVMEAVSLHPAVVGVAIADLVVRRQRRCLREVGNRKDGSYRTSGNQTAKSCTAYERH